jgi:hypothetical protein
MKPEKYIALEKCWTFYLKAIDENSTRLIIRGRGDPTGLFARSWSKQKFYLHPVNGLAARRWL